MNSVIPVDCIANIASFFDNEKDIIHLFETSKIYYNEIQSKIMQFVWRRLLEHDFAFELNEQIYLGSKDELINNYLKNNIDEFEDEDEIIKLRHSKGDYFEIFNKLKDINLINFESQFNKQEDYDYMFIYKQLCIRFQKYRKIFKSIYCPLKDIKKYFLDHKALVPTLWQSYLDLRQFAFGALDSRIQAIDQLIEDEYLDFKLYSILTNGQPEKGTSPILGVMQFYDYLKMGHLYALNKQFPLKNDNFYFIENERVYVRKNFLELKKGTIVWASKDYFFNVKVICPSLSNFLEIFASNLYEYNLKFNFNNLLIRFPNTTRFNNNLINKVIGSKITTNGVTIQANAIYIPYIEVENRAFFAYNIIISMSQDEDQSKSCKLVSRHWIIKNNNHLVDEVIGDGVIGLFPEIRPGITFEYQSCCHIERIHDSIVTNASMEGSFKFKNIINDTSFDAIIGKFPLTENIYYI